MSNYPVDSESEFCVEVSKITLEILSYHNQCRARLIRGSFGYLSYLRGHIQCDALICRLPKYDMTAYLEQERISSSS